MKCHPGNQLSPRNRMMSVFNKKKKKKWNWFTSQILLLCLFFFFFFESIILSASSVSHTFLPLWLKNPAALICKPVTSCCEHQDKWRQVMNTYAEVSFIRRAGLMIRSLTVHQQSKAQRNAFRQHVINMNKKIKLSHHLSELWWH